MSRKNTNTTYAPKYPKTEVQQQAKIIADGLRRGTIVLPCPLREGVYANEQLGETLAQVVVHYGNILSHRRGRNPGHLAMLADAVKEITKK